MIWRTTTHNGIVPLCAVECFVRTDATRRVCNCACISMPSVNKSNDAIHTPNHGHTQHSANTCVCQQNYCKTKQPVSLTFGGDPVPDTDSESRFHFPRHCRMAHFREFIIILHTVTGCFL